MNPEQARAELARRELARRELSRRGGASQDVAEQSGQYGALTHAPNIAEKISTNLTSKETKPLGLTGGLGVGMSAMGIPEEDILPAIGQGVGGMASGFPGAGVLGATGGAVVGQVVRQALKPLRGEESDYRTLGKEALTTGLIEGTTRGAGNLVFRRQIANETLGKLSKQISSMKDELGKNPALRARVDNVYATMRKAFDELPEPMQTGNVANKLKKWMKFMSDKPELSAKDLIHMESDLGKAATYGEITKGVFQPATEIPNPATNKIAKEGRTGISNIVDKLAQDSGVKDWKSVSKKISNLLKNPDTTDINKATGGFGQRLVAAGAVGGATANPWAGAATYFAMRGLQSPTLRNLAYGALRSPAGQAVNTGTKLSLSEIVRRLNK